MICGEFVPMGRCAQSAPTRIFQKTGLQTQPGLMNHVSNFVTGRLPPSSPAGFRLRHRQASVFVTGRLPSSSPAGFRLRHRQASVFVTGRLPSSSPARGFRSGQGGRAKAYGLYVEPNQRGHGRKDPAAFISCQKFCRLHRRDLVRCSRARSGGRRVRRRKFPRRGGSSEDIRCLRARRRGP